MTTTAECRHCGSDDLQDNGALRPADTEWKCMACGEYAPSCPGCGLPHVDEELANGERCDNCAETCPDCGSSIEERHGGANNCICPEPQDTDRSDDVCPCGDVDCWRPWGHE